MISQSNNTGKVGELLAARFLQQKGHIILRKNYRIPGAEIDLITRHQNRLIFVEVKTRRGDSFGSPEEALTNRKKRKISLAIYHYLRHNRIRREWRCDLIAIEIKRGEALIKHYYDIFQD